jgi:hypothetical protein
VSLLSRLLRFHGGTVSQEDFFTEVFAHLLSAYPGLCITWLNQSEALPLGDEYSHINVTTQRPFRALEGHQYASCPDVVIELFEDFAKEGVDDERPDEATVPPMDVVFVESKVGSREGQDQLRRYAEHLSALPEVRHRRLVYITRDYDPKDEDEIVGGLQESDTLVGFVPLRWHEFYRTLEDYRSTSLPDSDLIQEVLLFMKQNGMSQTNRLSAADVVALTGMPRMLAFMREILSGEVEARIGEVSKRKVSRANSALYQLATFDRYFLYAHMGPGFWVGGGFYLGQDDPDDYPWLSVLLEVGPSQPGREDIIKAMRSFTADCSGCEPYDLDDPSAWSGLEWAIDLREVLTTEDHMAAARTHFLESLDDIARMREQYPDLPWGSDT